MFAPSRSIGYNTASIFNTDLRCIHIIMMG
jgi:hypothetical protein